MDGKGGSNTHMVNDRFIELNSGLLSKQFHLAFSLGEKPYSLFDQFRRDIVADCINATHMYDDLPIRESRFLVICMSSYSEGLRVHERLKVDDILFAGAIGEGLKSLNDSIIRGFKRDERMNALRDKTDMYLANIEGPLQGPARKAIHVVLGELGDLAWESWR